MAYNPNEPRDESGKWTAFEGSSALKAAAGAKKAVTMANTKENNAIVKALKKIPETKWVGNIRHDSLDKALRAINLDSTNSGWYNPTATRINGLTGIYMINQDGSIKFDTRVIKEDDKKFLIEYMSTSGYNDFENLYNQFINED